MLISLDHMIVPARDRRVSAQRLATILGVPWGDANIGPFTAVYVSDSLTLDFDQWPEPIPVMHYRFHVSDDTFDAMLQRLQAENIAFRSTPHGVTDRQVNHHGGGRLLYWNEPDGHVWEILTKSYARQHTNSVR